MAEHYRFFNSDEGDIRDYTQDQYAEFWALFLSDGLYTDRDTGNLGCQVTPGTSGLKVAVGPGYAFIRGYMYHNDAPLELELAAADPMLDRIDRIVLRLDVVAREIRLRVRQGAPSSSPQPPALEITSTVKELSLARVRVAKGASSIAAANITDERLTDVCGLVSSLITIPAQEMWDVWNQALDQIEAEWAAKAQAIDGEWASQKAGIGSEWSSQKSGITGEWGTQKTTWQAWFESVQNTLGRRVMIGEDYPPEYASGDIMFKVTPR